MAEQRGVGQRVAERVRVAAPFVAGGLLTASSVLHLTRPGFFRPMIPPWLGPPDPWVKGSAAVEAVVGVGLLTAQPWAGKAGAALFLAVWPGNLQMALDAGHGTYQGRADSKVVAWARMPLQLPLVWAALQSKPRGRRGR